MVSGTVGLSKVSRYCSVWAGLVDRLNRPVASASSNFVASLLQFLLDINLFHTTVRYAGTNEVATINNGSVANMRIINGARSPNGMCVCAMRVSIYIYIYDIVT